MHKLAKTTAVGMLIIAVYGCSDPDKVPDSHVSMASDTAAATVQTVQRFPQKTALFGDLHVHTSWSVDAYTGDNRLGPNAAYRFARGERVELPNGEEAQLSVPLDFVALTDHAEGFGTHLACTIPGGEEFGRSQCRDVRSGKVDQDSLLENAFEVAGARPMPRAADACPDLGRCQANERTTWQRIQELANANNEPGRFTTLIGYEFSALLPEMGMLHRNVIFRGTDVTPHAISALDVRNQKDFFDQLDAGCTAPCEVLTIPHNTNYSWGLTFSRTDEDGSEYSDEDLARRARIERLFEITQQKGTSECQISVGAADEDCNFGILFPPCETDDDRRCTRPTSMYRNVLLEGLEIGSSGPLNPYKLGTIGSTDTHLSDPGNTNPGEIPEMMAGAEGIGFAINRLLEANHIVAGPIRKLSGGGLAGVWAHSNTRADIFDALQRRETFATSGSRMRIRFFGGDLPDDLSDAEDPVAIAYARGVPMGSDLDPQTEPRFWVWASQDPEGSLLDRIQIVKGWVENGKQHQRVWDVACSGGRQPDSSGHCPATTASVDLESCEQLGDQGARTLQAVFADPEFDATEPTFYYARVLENPSCHWTTRLANSADTDLPADLDPTTQERGWSSPIWSASR